LLYFLKSCLLSEKEVMKRETLNPKSEILNRVFMSFLPPFS